MEYTLSLDDVADEEIRKAVVAPLVEYNSSKPGPSHHLPITVLVKDHAGSNLVELWGYTGYD